MLVIEIAAGVLLGLISYRALFSNRGRRVISQEVGIVLTLGLLACLAYLAVALLIGIRSGFLIAFIKSYWYGIAVVVGVFVSARFIVVLRSDIQTQQRFAQSAADATCEKCGELGLVFRTLKGSLQPPSGHEYDRPVAQCRRCGHEQRITQSTN